MLPRFYCHQSIATQQVVLEGTEAHHLGQVLRALPGMKVTLFDGQGAEYLAEVRRASPRQVQLRILSRQDTDRELQRPLHLGVALPKGERQRWLVEKAVELGTSQLVPLVTQRGVAQPTGSAVERLQRYVVEASKQCGRNRLMEIGEPRSWCDWVKQANDQAVRWVADPSGNPVQPSAVPDRPAFVSVGPEGGLVEEELELARSTGWSVISLGPRILRVETAAMLLTSWWNLLARGE